MTAESYRGFGQSFPVRGEKESSWELRGTEFHKQYPDDAELEFEKARAIYEISVRRSFIYPRPLRIDSLTGTIVYSAISEMRSIRDVFLKYVCGLGSTGSAQDIFFESGRVLAVIHDQLTLSRRDDWQPDEIFRSLLRDMPEAVGHERRAFLHGDYGFANLFVVGDSARLVVIDASPNYFVTFSAACYGPVFVDIANMLSCMEGLVPLSRHFRMRLARVRELATVFLEGYESESEVDLDRSSLEQFTEATARSYLDYRFRSRILGRAGHLALYNSFRRSRLRPLV